MQDAAVHEHRREDRQDRGANVNQRPQGRKSRSGGTNAKVSTKRLEIRSLRRLEDDDGDVRNDEEARHEGARSEQDHVTGRITTRIDKRAQGRLLSTLVQKFP